MQCNLPDQATHRSPRLADPARLESLRRCGILDTPAEPAFDELVARAAASCQAPMALITLVDRQRQWFKARIGIDQSETTIERSICAKAIDHDGIFVVPDASVDPRVNSNPMVYGDPHIAFYAGAPLLDTDGRPLGMICVLDTVARPAGLSDAQRTELQTLALRVMALLEARRLAVSIAPTAVPAPPLEISDWRRVIRPWRSS
ncbi:GAF domain-containing protein [Piscinibacter sakaiensis]|uniref:GAF domain-containing protein n=1 Tax=Piscinibacter sakaiensis TaxID=1547922 RepID=UPI003AAE3C73